MKVDFREAGCYPTSSYAWKSIIQTQPLISQGTRWIVGDVEHAGFLQNKPRMMIRDFNDVKYTTEKQGGIKRSVSSLKLFAKMLAVLGLQDLKTLGGKFTWMGKRVKYTIMSKLDRAVANCDWLEMYPTAHVSLIS